MGSREHGNEMHGLESEVGQNAGTYSGRKDNEREDVPTGIGRCLTVEYAYGSRLRLRRPDNELSGLPTEGGDGRQRIPLEDRDTRRHSPRREPLSRRARGWYRRKKRRRKDDRQECLSYRHHWWASHQCHTGRTAVRLYDHWRASRQWHIGVSGGDRRSRSGFRGRATHRVALPVSDDGS